MERAGRAYWDRIALRWRIAEPLAPGIEDQAWFERHVAARAAGRALLLGVTARLATMRWPEGTTLAAADWSRGMLALLPPGRAAAFCADWRELPVAAASFDAVLGDGCYSAFAELEDMTLFNAELRRILRPGGLVLLRCFCRPAVPFDLDRLFADLHAGRVRNLDLFRWLVAMAVQGASRHGVALGDVWNAWAQRVPDGGALRSRLGWSDDAVANMERWAGSTMRYGFPTVEELRGLAAPHFEVTACDVPAYAWGALFPRLALRAR